MKIFLSILTIGLIVIGFLMPIAWIGAVITGFLAIVSSPAGKRVDGKARTGGLLGGIWDNYLISKNMTDCPFCKSKIKKEAVKCPHCGEWVIKQESGSQKANAKNKSADSPSIKGSLSKIGTLEAIIIILVGIIIISFIVGKLN